MTGWRGLAGSHAAPRTPGPGEGGHTTPPPTAPRGGRGVGIGGERGKGAVVVGNGAAGSRRALDPASRIAAEKPSEMRNLTPSPASDYIQATVGIGLEGSGP